VDAVYETILLEAAGGVATITLNRPASLNSINLQMVTDLHDAIGRVKDDPAVRCVVLTGTGRGFCAGADLNSSEIKSPDDIARGLREAYNPVIMLINGMEKPVIAAVNGVAAGAGCNMALACDLRIISEEAEIGLTETSWAIIPGAGGSVRLPQLVGPARAKELIFTARRLTASEALAMGLVNQVVPREELLTAAHEMAERIAAQGPLAVRAAKRALNGGAALQAALALEFEAYQSIIPTRDRLEGLKAFAEKRKPEYRGE